MKCSILLQFVVGYPNENITLVEGTIDGKLTSLKFTTSKGRTSPAFGNEDGSKFVFEKTGFKLVGFCGRSSNVINALGAHFAPFPAPVPAPAPASSPNKREALGGKGTGETFDDGAYDNVRKVYVGQVDSNVAYLKFEYEKDGRRITHEHGQRTSRGTEILEVGQDDGITSVKAYYEKLDGSKTETITHLAFKTLKGINSQPFGKTPVIVNDRTKLSLLEGGKITGFHGSSSDVLHSIGTYISVSPRTMLHGKWIKVRT